MPEIPTYGHLSRWQSDNVTWVQVSEKWQPAWCSVGCFNWLKQSNLRAVWGARGGKWWDRRSLLLFYSAVCHPPTLPACATVNIEIYYTLAFHHLLHTLRTCAAHLVFEFKKKRKFVFAALYVCLRMQQHTLICGDHKTVRCYWWLVKKKKKIKTNDVTASKELLMCKEQSISKIALSIHMPQSEQGTTSMMALWRLFFFIFYTSTKCVDWLFCL